LAGFLRDDNLIGHGRPVWQIRFDSVIDRT
jgi:hypothetical protein